MNDFLLNCEQMFNLKKLVGAAEVGSISLKEHMSADNCDRYDCFFRSVQCPCEGICDGKA